MAAINTMSITIMMTITTTIIATTIQMQTTHDATIDRVASLSHHYRYIFVTAGCV